MDRAETTSNKKLKIDVEKTDIAAGLFHDPIGLPSYPTG